MPSAVMPLLSTCSSSCLTLSCPSPCNFLLCQVVDLLCISDAEATRALRFYKWDLGKLQVTGAPNA